MTDLNKRHQHTYRVESEYQSTGKNLLGKTVTCTMEKVICNECGEDNHRRKQV